MDARSTVGSEDEDIQLSEDDSDPAKEWKSSGGLRWPDMQPGSLCSRRGDEAYIQEPQTCTLGYVTVVMESTHELRRLKCSFVLSAEDNKHVTI